MCEIDYERHYSRFHPDSDDHALEQGQKDVFMLRPYLPDDRDELILEIGSGRGYAIGGLLAAGFSNIRGFDANSGQVAYALKRGLPVDLVSITDTMRYLEQYHGRAGLILAIDVLEHIPQDELIGLVRQLVSCLRPGGRLYCRVPNAMPLTSNYMRHIDFTHYNAFTEASLDFVLHNSGLQNIEILPEPEMPPKDWRQSLYSIIRKLVRQGTRFVYRAEFGRQTALSMPMTPNLIGTGLRS